MKRCWDTNSQGEERARAKAAEVGESFNLFKKQEGGGRGWRGLSKRVARSPEVLSGVAGSIGSRDELGKVSVSDLLESGELAG